MGEEEPTRANEWYVPKFGPPRFRLFVGMTFIPYTLMNIGYIVIGSTLAPNSIHWDRVAGMVLVYLLAVGVSAHALDALSSNKPWGAFLTRKQLLALALSALLPALVLGLYYALVYAPWLILIGLAELFFLLSYDLELFKARFHTEAWFALGWGFLPVLAGFVLQTNALSPAAAAGSLFGFTTAYVEINASKPYKALKRQHGDPPLAEHERRFERILKGVVASVLVLAVLLVLYRLQ
ncbi:MAG: hypothetical protein ACLQEQ_02470 [Nitrososphaerales archaeon]